MLLSDIKEIKNGRLISRDKDESISICKNCAQGQKNHSGLLTTYVFNNQPCDICGRKSDLALALPLKKDSKDMTYPGNVGMVEMAEFYKKANTVQVAQMEKIIESNNWSEFKLLINQVLGVSLDAKDEDVNLTININKENETEMQEPEPSNVTAKVPVEGNIIYNGFTLKQDTETGEIDVFSPGGVKLTKAATYELAKSYIDNVRV